MGPVLPLQFQPRGVPFRRGHVRVPVGDVLELVHHAAVGDEGRRVLQVHLDIVPGPLPEEQGHPFLGEELHGHGVDLRGLHGDVGVLPDRILAGEPPLERVAALVCDHVHVPAGAVEIGEHERSLVHGHIRHVAPGPLGLAPKYVEQFIFHHEIVEIPCLRGELAVHLPPGLQDLLGRAQGRGIAFLKVDGRVDAAKLLQAQALPPAVMELLRKGDEVLLHLLPESLHLLPPVAVAAHAVVPQLQVIVVPQCPGLGGAVLHQLVVNLVQSLGVGGEEFALGLPGGGAHAPVLVHGVGAQQGQVQFLPVKGDLGARNQLAVFGGEIVLLLHQGNQPLVHGLLGDLHVLEGHGADLLHQLVPVRGGVELLLILQGQIVVDGGFLIVVIMLRAVEFVRGVRVVADVGDGHLGAHPVRQGIVLLMHRELLLAVLRAVEGLHQGPHLLLHLLKVHALIWHILEFHSVSSPFPVIFRFSLRIPGAAFHHPSHYSRFHGFFKLFAQPRAFPSKMPPDIVKFVFIFYKKLYKLHLAVSKCW